MVSRFRQVAARLASTDMDHLAYYLATDRATLTKGLIKSFMYRGGVIGVAIYLGYKAITSNYEGVRMGFLDWWDATGSAARIRHHNRPQRRSLFRRFADYVVDNTAYVRTYGADAWVGFASNIAKGRNGRRRFSDFTTAFNDAVEQKPDPHSVDLRRANQTPRTQRLDDCARTVMSRLFEDPFLEGDFLTLIRWAHKRPDDFSGLVNRFSVQARGIFESPKTRVAKLDQSKDFYDALGAVRAECGRTSRSNSSGHDAIAARYFLNATGGLMELFKNGVGLSNGHGPMGTAGPGF